MPRTQKKNADGNATPKTPKSIVSTQSLSSSVKSICDVMRRSNCASALQYVPELTWILFLRILDAQESRDKEKAEVLGTNFAPALRNPYRWQDWAAPYSEKPGHLKTAEGKPVGWKRQELFARGDGLSVGLSVLLTTKGRTCFVRMPARSARAQCASRRA